MVHVLEFLLSSNLCQLDCLTKDFTSNISVIIAGCVHLLLRRLGNAEALFLNLVTAE